nr:MAG TPA: hypothetical protein [Caudoviricetes sp.]
MEGIIKQMIGTQNNFHHSSYSYHPLIIFIIRIKNLHILNND